MYKVNHYNLYLRVGRGAFPSTFGVGDNCSDAGNIFVVRVEQNGTYVDIASIDSNKFDSTAKLRIDVADGEMNGGIIIMLDEKVKKYFENPRKLEKVEADDNFNLHLTFDNGETRIYKMENQLDGVFAVLKDEKKFKSVFIDEFGNAAWNIDDSVDSKIQWENRIDICKDALYMDSVPIGQ